MAGAATAAKEDQRVVDDARPMLRERRGLTDWWASRARHLDANARKRPAGSSLRPCGSLCGWPTRSPRRPLVGEESHADLGSVL